MISPRALSCILNVSLFPRRKSSGREGNKTRGLLASAPWMVANTSASVPAPGLSLVHSSRVYQSKCCWPLQQCHAHVSAAHGIVETSCHNDGDTLAWTSCKWISAFHGQLRTLLEAEALLRAYLARYEPVMMHVDVDFIDRHQVLDASYSGCLSRSIACNVTTD